MEYPIYYSVEEAKLLIPVVEEKILRLMKIHKALAFLSTINIENNEKNHSIDLMITKLNMNYYKKLYLYHKCLTELLTIGVVVKDVQMGLIDFYAKHEGRDVHLCWKLGEKDLGYWHETHEGFSKRQPIHMLQQKHIL